MRPTSSALALITVFASALALATDSIEAPRLAPNDTLPTDMGGLILFVELPGPTAKVYPKTDAMPVDVLLERADGARTRLARATTIGVFAVPAGRYILRESRALGAGSDKVDTGENWFEVGAGQIHYAGSWRLERYFRGGRNFVAAIKREPLDALNATHAAMFKRYGLWVSPLNQAPIVLAKPVVAEAPPATN